ncbi:Nucleotidyltransferase [Acaromyces ingoldii]|uniref:DNA polymerase n=1 Tax=Acaromyces ingoldii TaxID=215250 RepID=A0A316YMA2_9BASI|nr:Nucleotidyltransferase [Acaromyces ingoldii]PWN89934.1 Nucleotidyltransferase [Acaromyces ingoldii]
MSSPSRRRLSRNSQVVQTTTTSSFSTSPKSKTASRRDDFIAPSSEEGGPRQKGRILSSSTRIFIIKDKLEQIDVDRIRAAISSLGGMNASLRFANLILTGTRSAKRAQKFIDADAEQRKVPVVHHTWLDDSQRAGIMLPYADYLVISPKEPSPPETLKALEHETKATENVTEPAPPEEGSSTEVSSPERPSSASPSRGRERESKRKRRDSNSDSAAVAGDSSSREGSLGNEQVIGTANQPKTAGPSWCNSEYACMRPSPLKSLHNQGLVDQLETLRLQRTLTGGQEVNATAYGRAISAVKSYPRSIAPNPSLAASLKGVGPKIVKLIKQYYTNGSIAEVDEIRRDTSFQIMSQFTELYGIGPKKAREYYSEGCRTMDDVLRMGGSMGTHLHVEECLRILPDLRTKIPRPEVEEIARYIHQELKAILPDAVYTICGGFRRGKPQSNDVDIVFADTSPSTRSQLTAMEELLRALKKKAYVTHIINVTTPSDKYERVFSRLDIAEVVVLPPRSDTVPRSHYRRVDIIFSPLKTYGAAVLGWTGSRQFERDLRRIAQSRGYTFHSTGLTSNNDKTTLETTREEDIFSVLEIPYMPPELRNCDA